MANDLWRVAGLCRAYPFQLAALAVDDFTAGVLHILRFRRLNRELYGRLRFQSSLAFLGLGLTTRV